MFRLPPEEKNPHQCLLFFFEKVALLRGQGREELGGFQSSNTKASETRTNLCSNTTRTTTVE